VLFPRMHAYSVCIPCLPHPSHSCPIHKNYPFVFVLFYFESHTKLLLRICFPICVLVFPISAFIIYLLVLLFILYIQCHTIVQPHNNNMQYDGVAKQLHKNVFIIRLFACYARQSNEIVCLSYFPCILCLALVQFIMEVVVEHPVQNLKFWNSL
jgi:hypothetical protein